MFDKWKKKKQDIENKSLLELYGGEYNEEDEQDEQDEQEEKEKKLFVTSDTHFGDERLLGYTRTQFKTVEEMDEYIIKQWNSVVGKDDTVLHLGDVIGPYNSIKDAKERLSNIKKLNGHKILITGNYDRDFTKQQIYDAGFEDIVGDELQIGKYIFTHEPKTNVQKGFTNIHGHVHKGHLQKLLGISNRHKNVVCELRDFKPSAYNLEYM